ncbi:MULTISPECIES: hypothetical protein [unclassified Streptomyces]|jgi:hypothetical protein|uniref:hypothetical protein n=1 Tax=unclassified Streptomyces TaxID=2593676 RepID=UPI0027879A43|nr:hypothetical protein [Streptomyces sp. V1I1]MDQ0943099.1 hypothetical protein [Streptomyces sp. V1I1]
MHSDIHLQLHALRAAELRAEAAMYRRPRKDLRTQLGWTLIELGLRLVRQQPPARTARIA